MTQAIWFQHKNKNKNGVALSSGCLSDFSFESGVKKYRQLTGGNRLVDCGNGGGGGVCLIFDNVPEDSIGEVIVEDVMFSENNALVGGKPDVSLQRNVASF